MKEKEIMTENCNGRCENGFEKFEESEEEDDDVIIQLIVQGTSVNVSEQLLTRYSKYFWNLLQNLPPLPQKNSSKPLNGKNSKIMGFLKKPCCQIKLVLDIFIPSDDITFYLFFTYR